MTHRYAATDEERREGSRRRRRRVVISLVVVVALLAGLAAVGGYLWSQYGERISSALGWTSNDYDGEGHGEASITILTGEIGEDVAESLAEAGIVKTKEAFYELLLAQATPVEFMPGLYTLRLEMSAQAALNALQDPANRAEFKATIPEGRTVAQALEIVAAGAGIPLEELQAAAADPSIFGVPAGVGSLEGWIYPATYEFEPGASAHDAIARMVGYQIAVLDELGVAVEDRERVLTVASIVEREAGIAADFGKVSRVIANRLEIGMMLQMDSTAQYGMQEHESGSVWSSDEALADDNPWNTYVHTGLPIGPIANPGRAAIEAALYPEAGDWIYFVVTPGGGGASTFSATLEAHQAAVQEYVEWCAATPDSGC